MVAKLFWVVAAAAIAYAVYSPAAARAYIDDFLASALFDVATHAAQVAAAAALVLYGLVLLLASKYKGMIAGNRVDVDAYVSDPQPSVSSRAKCVLLNYLNVGSRMASTVALPLAEEASPYVEGLQVTSRAGTRDGSVPFAPGKSGAIVVGTIRMGFGHHRIAYAAASHGVDSGRTTYFHDLLNIDSPEATLIKDMDALYSKGSRLATELGGAVEKLWGSFTKGGDENALRVSYAEIARCIPSRRG